MTFTPTQWNTVEDKEQFVKRFKRFVEGRFKETLFTKGFYQRMSMMRGHIAHYNQDGFFSSWFSTADRRADFLQRWTIRPFNGDPAYTWSDVERVIAEWLQEYPEHVQRERDVHITLIEKAEQAELARLKAKYE